MYKIIKINLLQNKCGLHMRKVAYCYYKSVNNGLLQLTMYVICASTTFTGVVFSLIIQFQSQTGVVLSLYKCISGANGKCIRWHSLLLIIVNKIYILSNCSYQSITEKLSVAEFKLVV